MTNAAAEIKGLEEIPASRSDQIHGHEVPEIDPFRTLTNDVSTRQINCGPRENPKFRSERDDLISRLNCLFGRRR